MPAHSALCETATPVGTASITNGDLETEGDVDFFSFPAEAGQTYVLETSLDTLGDTVLTLVDASGIELDFNNDIAPGQLASGIDYTADTTGTLYFGVQAYSSSMLGFYAVSVSLQTSAVPPTVVQKLERMNVLIQEAITLYGNVDIDEAELISWINATVALKFEVLRGFPLAFGNNFETWYLDFKKLNDLLDSAYLLASSSSTFESTVIAKLEEVKRQKELIEEKIRRGGSGGNRHLEVLGRLESMNQALQAMIDDYGNDVYEEEQLRWRINGLVAAKRSIMNLFPFPSGVGGESRWGDVYQSFAILDYALREANLEANDLLVGRD